MAKIISQSIQKPAKAQRYKCERCGIETSLAFPRGIRIPETLGAHNYTDNKEVKCGGKIMAVPDESAPVPAKVN